MIKMEKLRLDDMIKLMKGRETQGWMRGLLNSIVASHRYLKFHSFYNQNINKINLNWLMNQITNSHSYSTIFQCDEDFFTCFLRFCEGLVSLAMFLIFLKGYKALSSQNNNPISKQDKHIYMLAMAQTFILTLYYFLFEQFFILATIRNLLIWISINVLDLLCKIYWINQPDTLRKANFGINFLKVINFFMWFVIAVGDGSSLANTNFNLGYNCRLIDWTILSGVLLIITSTEGFITFQIIDRLNWQLKQPNNQQDKNKIFSIEQQKYDMIYLVGGSIAGAFIMFVWDYLAFSISDNDDQCQELFSGNTFFRKILCFLLKIISMQVVPSICYYTTYYKRKSQFLLSQTTHDTMADIDYLNDDAASQLNRTLTERSNSRMSLQSGRLGSTANL